MSSSKELKDLLTKVYVEARPYIENAKKARRLLESAYDRCEDPECVIRFLEKAEREAETETERADMRILRDKLEGMLKS
ncbi:hypothetical protein [Methanopyrus sp.]